VTPTTVITLGVYNEAHPQGANYFAARRQAIRDRCRSEKLPAPSFDKPDHIQATVAGIDLLGKRRQHTGVRVVLVGSVDDLHAPQGQGVPVGSFSEHEWREAWLEYLNTSSLSWSPIFPPNPSTDGGVISRQSVIRSYLRSCHALAKVIARARSQRSMAERGQVAGYSYGRPPYGYHVINGVMLPNPKQVEAVKRVFVLVRNGAFVAEAATIMRTASNGREYWDAVKVRRLLAHKRLYCMGEYDTPGGEMSTISNLVILPSGWKDTTPPVAIPSRRGTGTVKAPKASTPRE